MLKFRDRAPDRNFSLGLGHSGLALFSVSGWRLDGSARSQTPQVRSRLQSGNNFGLGLSREAKILISRSRARKLVLSINITGGHPVSAAAPRDTQSPPVLLLSSGLGLVKMVLATSLLAGITPSFNGSRSFVLYMLLLAHTRVTMVVAVCLLSTFLRYVSRHVISPYCLAR